MYIQWVRQALHNHSLVKSQWINAKVKWFSNFTRDERVESSCIEIWKGWARERRAWEALRLWDKDRKTCQEILTSLNCTTEPRTYSLLWNMKEWMLNWFTVHIVVEDFFLWIRMPSHHWSVKKWLPYQVLASIYSNTCWYSIVIFGRFDFRFSRNEMSTVNRLFSLDGF